MKRRYQIEGQRAVNEFRQLAANRNPKVQMVLPMAEIVSLLQQGLWPAERSRISADEPGDGTLR